MRIIKEFKGEFRFLSNFYPTHVIYDGRSYLSVEHAYQAAKCHDVLMRKQFRVPGLTAGEAKKLGRTVTIRPDWENVKWYIMQSLVLDKFYRHSELREKLLATQFSKLEEGNTWGDTYWGVDLATGKGDNHLGYILMDIRGAFL